MNWVSGKYLRYILFAVFVSCTENSVKLRVEHERGNNDHEDEPW